MKGKNYLKVTGILMIIGGCIGIIGGIIALISVGALATLLETSMGSLMLGSLLVLISSIIQLFAGIMGVRYCARPEKAQNCMMIGTVVAVLSVVGNLISVAAGNGFNVMNMITGLILPVLYIVGAMLNKKDSNNV